MISSGDKTLEYQICLANVFDTAEEIKAGLLYKLIKSLNPKGIANVDDYISTKITGNLSSDQKQDISILLWKCLPGKAEFAHYLEDKVLSNLNEQNPDRFVVPPYIQNAINFLIPC
jgi:putative ATP-dependent endonuclease of OLD family